MGYTNFKATIWSKKIQQEKEKLMAFYDICNSNFQGEAGQGKTVKIIGAARPAINTYVPGTAISSAETPLDTSQTLAIDQYKYFNIQVDDVDQAQSEAKILDAYTKGGAKSLAEESDAYIAGICADSENKITKTTAITTPADAKVAIDEAFIKLWEAGVGLAEETFIVMPPWFYNLFKSSLQELLTNNADMIKKGIVGWYNNALVKLSNQVHNDGTYDNIIVCNKDAVTFADGISETEAYRPHTGFCDAIKALNTYGCKIVRPAEIVTVQVKATTETEEDTVQADA